MFTRIGHSAKFHATRSAFNSKGSFASKLIRTIGTAGRAVVGCIPLPLVGGVIAAAEKAIESKIRSKIHDHKAHKTQNLRTHVKFALKEMSVENLDRYRAKLEFAVNDLNSAVQAHGNTLQDYARQAKPCNAFWELALAVAQAERRAMKLMAACVDIETLMQMTRFVALRSSTGQDLVFSEPKVSGDVNINSITGIKKQMISQYIEYVRNEVRLADATAQGVRVDYNVAGANVQGEIVKHVAGTKLEYANIQQLKTDLPQVQQANLVQHHGPQNNAIEYVRAFHGKCGDCCCFIDLLSDDKMKRWDEVKNNICALMSALRILPDGLGLRHHASSRYHSLQLG